MARSAVISKMSAKDLLATAEQVKEKLVANGEEYNPLTCKIFAEFLRRCKNNLMKIGTKAYGAEYAAQNASLAVKRLSLLAGAEVNVEVKGYEKDENDVSTPVWGMTIGGVETGVAPVEATPKVIRASEVGDATLDAIFGGIDHLKSKDLTQARAILVMYEAGIEGSDLAKSLGVKSLTQSLIARSLAVTPGYVSNVIREERIKRDTPAPVVDTDAVFTVLDGLV